MKRSFYAERDYAFGQRMLSLRMSIGLTQAELANKLGVSRRAVGEWEAGSAYPKAQHLKALLALCVRQQVFAAGQEEEEIRTLWKAAHQKVLLDESWLSALLKLKQPSLPPVSMPLAESDRVEAITAPATDLSQASQQGQRLPSLEPFESNTSSASGPRVDWGEALEVPSFYGREEELATLEQWMVQQRCRVVSVLGLGGIGKSALVTNAMRQVAPHFQVVLFRSLRDTPSCEALLEDCLQRLAPQPMDVATADLERRLSLLLEELRAQRVLLVLDNLESVLQAGEAKGRLRAGYEGYARLLQALAQRGHQSCLLLTSREKPSELRALEGRSTPVRSLRLTGLEAAACEQLLLSHELIGSPQERARLIALYEGNPLALNIVAQTIADLFGGLISPFLSTNTAIFGGIAELLEEQWSRLSVPEQTLLFWLAILRDPVTLQELQAVLVVPLAHGQMLEAVDGLRRRSLIEQGQRTGSFTLQSVVLEYVTGNLVEQLVGEIVQGQISLLIQHRLCQALAREYVRQTQERLLVAPLLARLQSVYQGPAEVEQRLRSLLEEQRGWAEDRQGYGPANLVTLLRALRGNLRGLDLSRLVLRSVHLQGVEMQNANLAGALIQESVFTETFDVITAVAISPTGHYWAAAGRRGEVRVWKEEQEVGLTLHLVWQAHSDTTYALALSPAGGLLVSGSWDDTLKLWDVESGALLWSSLHPNGVQSLAIAPNGGLLVTGGNDATARLWDLQSGRQLQMLPHPSPVRSVAWSPDGGKLATGDLDGQIRLWRIPHTGPATWVQTLTSHSNRVLGLAFAPNGRTLASASWDGTVKLWDVQSGAVLQTLLGHTDRVSRVVWSPDGRMLASGGRDSTIWLWDVQQSSYRAALQGHSVSVNSLSFTPDGRSLLSGSDDGTMRLWDVESAQCMRVIQGYAASLFDVDWSPDGMQLASVGSDTVVTIWNVNRQAEGGRTPAQVFSGHRGVVYAVAWSPDGRFLASSAWDDAISLWNVTTGTRAQVLRDRDNPNTILRGVAWSPDGRFLASGISSYGGQVWEITTHRRHWVGHQISTWVRHLAWNPGGTQLVGGGDDGKVYVWDASDGTLLQQLMGHHGVVTSVAFSPDGKWLVSAGRSRGSGELVLWDTQSWQKVQAIVQQGGVIYDVAWSVSGERLISGGSDGMLRWWQVESGECVLVRQAHAGTIRSLRSSPDSSKLASCGDDGAITLWDIERGEHLRTLRRDRPYEQLNISGIRGLTEAQKVTLRGLGATEDITVSITPAELS